MKKFYYENALDSKRAIELKPGESIGPVIYWVNRDIRIRDNHTFAFAQSLAIEHKQPLIIYYIFDPQLNSINDRQLPFLIDSLELFNANLRKLNIPFIFETGERADSIIKTAKKYNIGVVVTDFSPLRYDLKTINELVGKLPASLYQVDAHNIVPCWTASDKKEYAAYTIRKKINKLIYKFDAPAPEIIKHKYNAELKFESPAWSTIRKRLKIKKFELSFAPGESAAQNALSQFIKNKLSTYADRRNDPTADNQSNLSPYLHFGLISSRTVMEAAQTSRAPHDAIEQFLDELIVRKELSDNFCYYEKKYDSIDGFAPWAKETLTQHQSDPRQYIYSRKQFEAAETHDNLWNAAQFEMIATGKMHGYMRMYWAKKIFEWSVSPEEAMATAIYLNDKYSLDGNDPNGYAGIAWSIGGTHDRPWFEREIFGKVRYMNYNGCKRKFDVQSYINRFSGKKRVV